MRKINFGFTIVELVVVIAVIGVLAAISTIGFTRYQADARDTQRVSKATVIAEALEKYYDANGEYPGCSTITQSGDLINTTVLTGIEKTALVTPKAESGTTNSIVCEDIANTDADIFAYTGDGSATCTSGSACLQWTITYRDEVTGSTETISSRRKANIASSSPITNLTASSPSFSTVDLDWSDTSGAISYQVQAATNAGFTTGLIQSTSSTNSTTVSGLTADTPYYFRVMAVSLSGGTSGPSNTATATTLQLASPVSSGAVNSYSQVTFSWTAISGATSYNTQYSTSSTVDSNGNFTVSPVTATGITTPRTRVVSSLSPNTTLYFRAKAVNASTASAWSPTVSAATTIPAPTGLTAVSNSATAITASWSAVSGVSSYTLQYSTSASFTSPTSITGITGTSRQVTGLGQGQRYYFRVYAVVSSVSSAASSSANATNTINQPAAPSPQFGNSWANNQYVVVNWTTYCPAGTSAVNGNFTSMSWISGDYYYHGFGWNDWWTLGPGGGATVYYWARYACQTSFVTSATSPDHYYTVWIRP